MASMAAGSNMTILHEELIAIDGVADAQVEVIDDVFPSVRLQIDPGADRRQVGAILARSGRAAGRSTESSACCPLSLRYSP